LLGSWPQADIGIVLWSLSVSAGDWQTNEKLTRLCTIPEPAILSGTWDRSAYAMEERAQPDGRRKLDNGVYDTGA
jgi:hypothetical protein